MTTQEHLVYTLQEAYSFHRDVLPLLDSFRHMSVDERVRMILQTEIDGRRGEMETTERALNLLGARFKMEHSTLGVSLKEASDRFRHEMSLSRPQQDSHALMMILTISNVTRGKYQVAREMALVLGEQDVVKLLEEMDDREVTGQADAGELLPRLLQEINAQEVRKRAA